MGLMHCSRDVEALCVGAPDVRFDQKVVRALRGFQQTKTEPNKILG